MNLILYEVFALVRAGKTFYQLLRFIESNSEFHPHMSLAPDWKKGIWTVGSDKLYSGGGYVLELVSLCQTSFTDEVLILSVNHFIDSYIIGFQSPLNRNEFYELSKRDPIQRRRSPL